jgi:uncharacterized protein, PH0010 family
MKAEEGQIAVSVARKFAEAEIEGKNVDVTFPASFSELKGVFVTISEYPSGDLRGCIGYPEPFFQLRDALRMSAVAACHDPRFDDLTIGEAKRCTFEVTILSPPEKIEYSEPSQLLKAIEIGRDGLILELNGRRGLLLPQVPIEWMWEVEEFLEHLSQKAGLRPNAWQHPDAIIKRFEGEIYSEVSPEGEVRRK